MPKLVEAFKEEAQLVPCPKCGKLMPKGVVACWVCGEFLDPAYKARLEALKRE